MNILPLLHFFTFLLYYSLIIFILWKDPKSSLNRVCAAFLSCFALLSFGYIFLYNPGILKDTAILFANIASIGWISVPSFFLWFALIFTEEKKILKTQIFYFFIFVLPLFLIYIQWTGFLTDLIEQPRGWAGILSDSIWAYLYYFYFFSFAVIGLYLIYNFGKKTKEPLKKKQAKIILITSLISFVFSIMIDVIPSTLNVFTTIPSLANVISLIWAGGLVYAMTRYRLMVITPVTAAEKIISTMADSLILLDREGSINTVNEALLDLSGYHKDELTGKSVEIFFLDKDFKNSLLEKANRKINIRNHEPTLKTKTGKDIPVLFSSSVMVDKVEGIVGIVCIIKDITQYKQITDALKETEQRFKNVTENAQEWIWETDTYGKYVYCSPASEKILGYKPEELLGKHFYDSFAPKEKKQLKKLAFDNFTAKKSFHEFINLNIRKDGKPVWISSSGVPILDKKGNLLGYRGVDMDITKYKQLEGMLREDRKKYREIIDGMNDTVWVINSDCKLIDVNKAAVKVLGYSREEFLSMELIDIDANLSDEVIKNLVQQMPYDEIQTFETKHKTKEGKIIPVEISSSLVTYLGKKRILSIARDITERKKTEEALLKSHQEFISLFQSNPEATVYADEKGNILNINTRFTELFGYTLDEIKGKNIDGSVFHPPEKINEGQELTKEYFSFETIRKKKDGILFPVYISGSLVIINGKHKGMIVTYYDITERKAIEKQLEKLARIDSLTGCYNRRYGLELLDRQIKLSHRNQSPLLLAFLDIDNFKTINDTYGHNEGDNVLKEVVKLFKSTLREVDIICRMGGDEFLLIFPDTSLQEVPLIRDRIKEKLVKLNREIEKDYNIQFSIGFSEYVPDKPQSLDELIAIADKRMYEEKYRKK